MRRKLPETLAKFMILYRIALQEYGIVSPLLFPKRESGFDMADAVMDLCDLESRMGYTQMRHVVSSIMNAVFGDEFMGGDVISADEEASEKCGHKVAYHQTFF